MTTEKAKGKRCECPLEGNGNMPESMYSEDEQIGRIHKPNECKCTAGLKQYIRRGKKIWLCSCCYMPGDEEL